MQKTIKITPQQPAEPRHQYRERLLTQLYRSSPEHHHAARRRTLIRLI